MSGHSKWATTKHKKAANDAKRGKEFAKLIKNIEVAARTIMYEGYGPNGVAMLIECLTDNRNRAATDVRTAMSKNGGNLGESGSVAYMFSRTGIVLVNKGELTEDDVLMAVLEAGAEEVNDLGEKFEVVCQPGDIPAVKEALVEAGIEVDDNDTDFRASVEVPLGAADARKIFRLIDALEESDDVQNVYTNMDLSEEVLAELEQD